MKVVPIEETRARVEKLKAEQAAKAVSSIVEPNQRPMLAKLQSWIAQIRRLIAVKR